MSRLTATTMKEVIEKILTSHGLLEQFNAREDFHVKIENEPYMPLTIEKHSRQVIVAHNYVQNGDLIPDPDMEFWIEQNGAWSPVTIQFATGHYRQCMDGVIFNERERGDQVSFSKMWARNLEGTAIRQGTNHPSQRRGVNVISRAGVIRPAFSRLLHPKGTT